MNSWGIRTLSQNDGHNRSSSIADYNEIMNGGYSPSIMVSHWNGNRLSNQYHTSFMDLNKMADSPSDQRQQFSWRNPIMTSQSLHCYPLFTNQNSGDNAFRTAIAKMKESSIYRLDTNAKPTPFVHDLIQQSSDKYYPRNCMTLPPKKTVVDDRLPKLSHKIFKCNSTAEHGRDGILSTNLPIIDCVSETESDKSYKDNQYKSVSNLYSDHVQWKENTIAKRNINLQKENHSSDGIKNHSGSHIVIPAHKSIKSIQERERTSEVTEQHISPKVVCKPQSALPKYEQYNINKEDLEIDSLSSITETLSNDRNDDKIMTRSLILISDKPPLKKVQRNDNQKIADGYSISGQSDQATPTGNKMSGLYKKTSPISSKGKSLSNMPVDFRKLHSAFLDQKSEIKHLKEELEEKKSYIIQLESEIRSYEPWR